MGRGVVVLDALEVELTISNLVTDNDGKVQVSGCEAGTLQARSTHSVGLSGTINVEGYCEETFTAVTSGSEIVVNLTQSKGNPNPNFIPTNISLSVQSL